MNRIFTLLILTFMTTLAVKAQDPVGFDLSIRGGWSYRTASAHPDLSGEALKHYKGLRSGYHIGGDAAYYFSETIGTGLKYTMAHFQNSTSGMEDKIGLQYIGPGVYGRLVSANEKTHFTYDLSIGYLHYKDEGNYGQQFRISGGTLGMSGGIGVDFKMTEHFFLGLATSWDYGTLNRIKIETSQQAETIELEEDDRENLSRLDLSLRLKWNL